jgi:hypothetical protein
MRSRHARLSSLILVALALACGYDEAMITPDFLSGGTWGGQGAGVIVGDATVHVHIGCTNGNFLVPMELDDDGRFSVSGEYMLRAFPIPIGPTLPAQFAGTVNGRRLTLTVAVNDTVEKKLVVLGPVLVTLGVEPRMGPCPICRTRAASYGRSPYARRTWGYGFDGSTAGKDRITAGIAHSSHHALFASIR